ncbi:H-NS histone family protein [Paraburkholderia phytofirmans]|uniref:H-NS histone family protein n=1 Tax=Paraburkholderia phytofirmans TaxID=261302 RepID=UPI0038BCC2D8
MNQNEIVATSAAIEVAAQPAGTASDYDQIEAEFARYEAEAAAIKQRMEALSEQRENLRKQERVIAIPEILARIAALGIKPEDLGFAANPSKPVGPVVHKYRNPETGKTHSGKGSLPEWLVGKTGKGRSGDPRYLNPAWVAKEDAKDAARQATSGAGGSNDVALASENDVSLNDDDQRSTPRAAAEMADQMLSL